MLPSPLPQHDAQDQAMGDPLHAAHHSLALSIIITQRGSAALEQDRL